MIHIEGCPHVAHYVAGQRERHGGGVMYSPDIERIDADTEIVRMVIDDSSFVDWVDARVTAESLPSLGAYKRCSVCAPDVPEYNPATRYVSKEAGVLTSKDVGRISVLGRIISVTHHEGGVRVEIDGGSHDLRPDDRVEFAVQPRSDAGRSRATNRRE